MMKHLAVLLGVLLLCGAARAETARVTYVTSRSFYVDAGQAAGLVPEVMVDVIRDGTVIGQARVREVSATRGVCEWTGAGGGPLVGDEIRFSAVEVSAGAVPGAERPSRWERLGLHGRIGLQTLHLRDRSEYGADFDQPALTLRLQGDRVAGTPLGLEADVRARMLTRDGQSSSRSRVYRLNVSQGNDAEGFGWTAGRQFAPALSVLNLFDGVRLQYQNPRWSTGVLGGTQPEPKYYGLSTRVVEGGGWFTLRETQARTRWSATVAAIGSYEDGSIDREFAWLQGRVAHGPLSLRVDQVLDLNRGWKQDAGESVISSTSTYLAARWQVRPTFSVDGGLDSRRQVRFYRDRQTPETEFDDAYRQGYWAGLRARPLRWLDLGLRGRTRLRRDYERADSGDLTVGLVDRKWSRARLDSRTAVYRGELVEGWLQSLRLSVPVHARVRAGVFGGVRSEDGRKTDLMNGTDPWFGLDVDFTLPHDVWLSASLETSYDGEEAYDQLWAGMGLSF